MKICDRVKVARLLAGLTNDALAALLGIAPVNVIRWQGGNYRLPQRQITPLATATGFPAPWFEGGDLEGLVVARPIKPDTRSQRNFLQANYAETRELVPEMCPEASISASRADGGTLYLLTAERYCLAIVAHEESNLRLDLQHNREEKLEGGSWEGLFHGDQKVLDSLLAKARLGRWLRKAPAQQKALAHASVEIRVLDAAAEQLVVAEILRFVQEIRRRGGCELSYTINTQGDKTGDKQA